MAWVTDSLRNAIAAVAPFFGRQASPIALSGLGASQLALTAYLASGMMRKVITVPADDRVREWRDWQAEKDDIAAIEEEEKRLGLIAKVRFAEVLRGIGGGALILAAPGDPAMPINPRAIGAKGLQAINVVSRWQITGEDWVTELTDPAYGTPQVWRVSGDKGETRIHPSRVIAFRGDPIPAGLGISLEDAYWGDCRLNRVMREVQNSDNSFGWFAELVKKAKLLRIGIPDLADMVATDSGKAKLAARVQTIAEGESVLNATVFSSAAGDGAGETITDYQVTWAGIPAMMDAFDQRVAAVADIPFTRLMGRSPAGMNATGQHDTDNWNRAVTSAQKLETRPCLEAFDEVLIRSAGVDPTDVTWRFAPLDTPSEADEATTFKTTMDAITELQATGAIPEPAFTKAVQNLMAEREWLPGLDQALAELPEDIRFGLAPKPADDPNAPDPSALVAKGGDPASADDPAGVASAGRRRAANDRDLRDKGPAPKHGFNPGQPRVPAGAPGGGEWVGGNLAHTARLGIKSVTAVNAVDEDHLAEVMAEMAHKGAPTIRVVRAGRSHMAIEGSHRLEAAKRLGLVPRFEQIDPGKTYHSSEFPTDFSHEFYGSNAHDESRDDNNGINDFGIPGHAIAAYAETNSGKKYLVSSFAKAKAR